MSIQILTDNEQGYKCLFCNTTMWAFGGIFYEDEEPSEFLDWLKEDARTLTDADLSIKISTWRMGLNDVAPF